MAEPHDPLIDDVLADAEGMDDIEQQQGPRRHAYPDVVIDHIIENAVQFYPNDTLTRQCVRRVLDATFESGFALVATIRMIQN